MARRADSVILHTMKSLLQNMVWASLDTPGDMACEKLEQYDGTGADIFIVANSSKPFMLGWHGGDRWEYREYDGEIAKLLRRKPDLRLIVEVGTYPGVAPLLWCREHEDQLVRHADGIILRAPSLASVLWRTESAEAIQKLVAHFEQSSFADNIVGYLPVCHTHEWHGIGEGPTELPAHEIDLANSYGDFSEPMVQGYRAWLTDKYGSDEALRSAWNDAAVSLATVMPPVRGERVCDPDGNLFYHRENHGRQLVDYFTFYNELHADLALAWCRAVKERCGGGKIVGLMHGLVYGWPHEASSPQAAGHAAAKRMLESKDIDFFASNFNYTNRGPLGTHYPQHAVDSVNLHGKFFVDVVESGTHARRSAHRHISLMMGGQEDEDPAKRWEAEDEKGSEELLKRDAAYAITHCGAALCWLDQRCPIHSHWFTHHQWGPLAYDTPGLREVLTRVNRIVQDAKKLPGESVAEVAVFTSAESCLHRTPERSFGNYFVEGFRQFILPYLGVPFDDYLLEDWEAVLESGRTYKAMIFLDALFVPREVRASIRSHLENNETLAIWFYAPGYIDEDGCTLNHCEKLTGIKLVKRNEKKVLFAEPVFDGEHPMLLFGRYNDVESLEYAMIKAQWPEDRAFCPVFYADDPDAEVLAVFQDEGMNTIARKTVGQGTSLYIGAPLPTARWIREELENAGVHIYSRQEDLVYANSRYVCVTCRRAGHKEIFLPQEAEVEEVYEGEEMGKKRCIRYTAMEGETRIYSLVRMKKSDI